MYQLYLGDIGYGASITIPGVGSFYLITGAEGYYAGAVGHNVGAGDSPLVINFDSTSVNLGDVYQAIMAKLPPSGS